MKIFLDRRQAGRALGQRLLEYAGRPDAIVLGLPRGGIPVAYEVAAVLRAPLDVLTVRKIGAPWNPEFAIGAIASGGMVYIDDATVAQLGVRPHEIDETISVEREELARREQLYRGARAFPTLQDRTVILVDDGLATGSTMRAAIQAVRTAHPHEVIVAAPVSSREACGMLAVVADRCVCAATPEPFYGVGLWYEDFNPTSDEEVLDLLARSQHERSRTVGSDDAVRGALKA
jgi:putative phosphoribosyl transferase